jgi:cytochrome c-type biogenesis protein CcmH
MLWLIFAILTALAVIAVLWPLTTAQGAVKRRDSGIAIYKAQLAEIERDETQSLLTLEDAQAAKSEAARRLLAAYSEAEPASVVSQTRIRLASLAVLIFVPALSLALYERIGHPDMPDAPLAARLEAAPQQMDLAAAIAKIEAHLKEHPEDGRGYEILAPVYLHLGRADDAVNAARAALRLLGETSARDALYGETLVVAANGIVTAEGRQAFEAAAAKDPSAAKPRFFLGLAAEQAGDVARAKEIWSKLIAEAPEDAPWAQALRERIAALDNRPDNRPGEASNGLAAEIGVLPEAQRMNAIRGMVEGLAARLDQNGHDLEGWLRLVRSYTVLHEPGKARSAILGAKRNFADDKDALMRLDALARELGLEG